MSREVLRLSEEVYGALDSAAILALGAAFPVR